MSHLMRDMGSVLVAYSGGVDSAYLAMTANRVLGGEALCVLGLSPSVSSRQRNEAQTIAADLGFNFRTISTEELDDPHYSANPANRCYFCKTELYQKLRQLADELNIEHIVDGTNADDAGDHRPGRLAAEEKGVRSPLVEVGMTKAEIREMSRVHGLPSWDKLASPCLSSRIAHGVPVTIERLSRVERGEEFIRGLGFREFRVRIHGDLARIEIAPPELEKALNLSVANRLSEKFKKLGFRYVTLDLQGYRSGAMNEVRSQIKKENILEIDQ